jgi:hypothetical protein
VGRQLFEEAICGLIGDRTRLLVTHQLQFLPAADVVVVMDGGRVTHVRRAGVWDHSLVRRAIARSPGACVTVRGKAWAATTEPHVRRACVPVLRCDVILTSLYLEDHTGPKARVLRCAAVCVQVGGYDDLMAQGVDFHQFVKDEEVEKKKKDKAKDAKDKAVKAEEAERAMGAASATAKLSNGTGYDRVDADAAADAVEAAEAVPGAADAAAAATGGGAVAAATSGAGTEGDFGTGAAAVVPATDAAAAEASGEAASHPYGRTDTVRTLVSAVGSALVAPASGANGAAEADSPRTPRRPARFGGGSMQRHNSSLRRSTGSHGSMSRLARSDAAVGCRRATSWQQTRTRVYVDPSRRHRVQGP